FRRRSSDTPRDSGDLERDMPRAAMLRTGLVPVYFARICPICVEPPRGFEPRTYALRVRCSTPELRRPAPPGKPRRKPANATRRLRGRFTRRCALGTTTQLRPGGRFARPPRG